MLFHCSFSPRTFCLYVWFFSLGRGEERNKTSPKFIYIYMYIWLKRCVMVVSFLPCVEWRGGHMAETPHTLQLSTRYLLTRPPFKHCNLKPGIGAETLVSFYLLSAYKTPIQALHLKPGIGTETHVPSSLGGCMLLFWLLFAISSSLS